jgi:hypothetical protein
MFRSIVLATGVALFGFTSAMAIEVDGKFDAGEGYSLEFDVSFSLEDGSVVEGGKLYFGADGDAQYMYFAMPKAFVDNSYGANTIDTDPGDASAGLYNDGTKVHTLDGQLLGSDALGKDPVMTLTTQDGVIQLTVDYIAKEGPEDDRGKIDTVENLLSGGLYTKDELNAPDDGRAWDKVDVPDPAVNGSSYDLADIDIATSMEYNAETYFTDDGDLTDDPLWADSPETAPGTWDVLDGTYSDWQFQVGYEFGFANKGDGTTWFGPDWLDATQVLSFINLGESHVSPHRLAKFSDYEEIVECEVDCDLDREEVPEPGLIGLLGLGLAGLAVTARRRRAKAIS